MSTYCDSQILYYAIQECLNLAYDQKYRSVSFPAIGTGHLGFSKQEVAHVMTAAVEDTAKNMRTAMGVDFVIYPPEHDTFMVTALRVVRVQPGQKRAVLLLALIVSNL